MPLNVPPPLPPQRSVSPLRRLPEDLADAELKEALQMASKNVVYAPNDYRHEIARRGTERQARHGFILGVVGTILGAAGLIVAIAAVIVAATAK